jgi:predicted nucleotidyltransferase
METIERKALTQDEMIMELLQLLKQNNMQQESKDTYELCAYIDSLEKKLDSMTTELVNMQNRIDELQESQISKAIQARMAEAKERITVQCKEIKVKIIQTKEAVREKAQNIVSDVKIRGMVALNRVSEILKVRDNLSVIRQKVREAKKNVTHEINKIKAVGESIREANQIIANAVRKYAEKPEVDYSKQERTVFKTDIVAAPWKAIEKLRNSAELHLDGAIDKVDNLALDVELSRNEEIKVGMCVNDSMVVTVGEKEHVYGAELFEEYQENQSEAKDSPKLKFQECKHSIKR